MPGELPSELQATHPQQYWAKDMPMTYDETERVLTTTEKVEAGWPLNKEDLRHVIWWATIQQNKPKHKCHHCGRAQPRDHMWSRLYSLTPGREQHWCPQCAYDKWGSPSCPWQDPPPSKLTLMCTCKTCRQFYIPTWCVKDNNSLTEHCQTCKPFPDSEPVSPTSQCSHDSLSN